MGYFHRELKRRTGYHIRDQVEGQARGQTRVRAKDYIEVSMRIQAADQAGYHVSAHARGLALTSLLMCQLAQINIHASARVSTLNLDEYMLQTR